MIKIPKKLIKDIKRLLIIALLLFFIKFFNEIKAANYTLSNIDNTQRENSLTIDINNHGLLTLSNLYHGLVSYSSRSRQTIDLRYSNHNEFSNRINVINDMIKVDKGVH